MNRVAIGDLHTIDDRRAWITGVHERSLVGMLQTDCQAKLTPLIFGMPVFDDAKPAHCVQCGDELGRS